MIYKTSLTMAQEWGVTKRSINLWCSTGKLPGAYKEGNRWMIPENAVRPNGKSLQISIGSQDFVKLRRNHNFYVDKSEFISMWWNGQDEVTLITRPRRFGKTMNISMLEAFFSLEYAGQAELFRGLKISSDRSMMGLQGTFPVINLSFASLKATNLADEKQCMKHLLVDLYVRFSFLKESAVLTTEEKQYFSFVKADMGDEEAVLAVQRLCLCLYRHYGKKVIVLLDEYDTPLQEAFVYGYWESFAPYIRQIFNAIFKSNLYLERGLLTGITRVSKESIFSDLNNLVVVTTTTSLYGDCFGFTQEEVETALYEFGKGDALADVKKWYDGFCFAGIENIYNPWSIQNYLKFGVFEAYWANTSSNALVNSLVQQSSPMVKQIMEDLLSGRSFETDLDEQIIFNQLYQNENAIWSLLLAGGYLKVEKKHTDTEHGRVIYSLRLTNLEVKIMFQQMIRTWFFDKMTAYNGFIKALLEGDTDYMNLYMNQVARSTFSSFDVGGKSGDVMQPERFYHGFVLGLLVDLSPTYQVVSNRESGFGRYDVMLIPRKAEMPGFVLEFKAFHEKRDRDLRGALRSALQQITEKQYDRELVEKGIAPERIRHIGFAFRGKEVLIGME